MKTFILICKIAKEYNLLNYRTIDKALYVIIKDQITLN